MLFFEQFSDALHKTIRHNKKKGFRHLIIVSGELNWVVDSLTSLNIVKEGLKGNDSSCLIYSDNPLLPSNVTSQTYRHKLGTQSKVVIYKDNALHLDILCALSGTLVSGGVLFLVLEKSLEHQTSPKKHDNFLARFSRKIHESSFIWHLEQDNLKLLSKNELDIVESDSESLQFNNFCFCRGILLGARTQEQYQAILAILNVVEGHRNRPLVLTADRGRGKSSALAIACAELIKNEKQPQKIVITAPHRNSLTVFFSQLLQSLQELSPVLNANLLSCGESNVCFMPIDELLNQKVDARIILVDEAASIPVYLLTSLANQYSRLVFSSTVHGYEGAGRGFGIIFQKALKQISPNMQKLHMKEPIRWAANDPLEKFISELCFLDAGLPEISKPEVISTNANDNARIFQRVTAHELANDDALLHDVFAILITAHYQTSPNDLKLLLENPKVHTLVLSETEKVIAVALIMEEGGEPDCDVTEIKLGKRRVKDQFLPQSLLSHLGIQESFEYHYHRILRIAVHPELQSIGVGSHFISKIQDYSQQLGVDFIGASFGLSSSLLNFWLSAQFSIARIGFNKDKASGEHSVMMLKSLSEKGSALQKQLISDFYRQFTYLLSDEFAQFSPRIVSQIISNTPKEDLPELLAQDERAVSDFALLYRQYSCCVLGIHHWLQHHLTDLKSDEYEEVSPLIMRVFQKHSVNDICQALGFTGKKELQSYMTNYLKNNLPR